MIATRGNWLMSNRHVPGTPLVVAMAGGSNCAGNPAATGNPSLLGFGSLPSSCTLYVDTTTPITTTYPTDKFGPEVGFLDELRNVLGFVDPIVVVKHGVPGSSLANWLSIYCAELIALYGTSGRPRHLLFVHGANDATGGVGASLYPANIALFSGVMRKDVGAGMGFSLASLSTADPVGYPNTAAVLAAQVAFAATGQGIRMLETADLPIRVEDSHYTGAAQLVIGRRYAQQLVADGIVVVPA